jgi:hypothetical protein
MTKQKKLNEGILKKLKPIELIRKNKAEKKDKQKEQEKFREKTTTEVNSQEHGFSDNSIWQTKDFDAPSITRSEAEPMPLERTADQAEISGISNQNLANETGINYSSIPQSESSAYRISSDYEGRNKNYDDRGTERTATSILGERENGAQHIVSPFTRPQEVHRSELEEFSRLEEQERVAREERQKLPFEQKNRREEIF